MKDDRDLDTRVLVARSRELCSITRATIASTKALLVQSRQLRERIAGDGGRAIDGNHKDDSLRAGF